MNKSVFAGALSCALLSVTISGCDSGSSSGSLTLPSAAPLSGGQKSDVGNLMTSLNRLNFALEQGQSLKLHGSTQSDASFSSDPSAVQMATTLSSSCNFSGSPNMESDNNTASDQAYTVDGAGCPVQASVQAHFRPYGEQSSITGNISIIDPSFRKQSDVFQFTATTKMTNNLSPVSPSGSTLTSSVGTMTGTIYSQTWGAVSMAMNVKTDFGAVPGRQGDFSQSTMIGLVFNMPGYTVTASSTTSQRCLAASQHTQYVLNGQVVTEADYNQVMGGNQYDTGSYSSGEASTDDSVCDQPANDPWPTGN